MTPQHPFVFLFAHDCPSSFLTSRIQLVANFILSTHWDCTFSRLDRGEDCERDPSQGREVGILGGCCGGLWPGEAYEEGGYQSISLEGEGEYVLLK